MLKPRSRPFQSGDETQIVALYNQITGRNRTVKQHQWEWLDSPGGHGKAWVIEDQSKKQIIGHHGLIPLRIVYNGQTYCLGKTENTIIHPQLMGNGMYFFYEKKFFLEYPENQFDLFATTSGHGIPKKIRSRLNYQPVNQYEIFFTLCSGANIKKTVVRYLRDKIQSKIIRNVAGHFSGFLSYLAYPFFRMKRHKDMNIEFVKIHSLNDIKKDLDEFWVTNRTQFGITIERSSDFLKWRIFDNPYVHYTFIALKQKNKLVGYAILKKKNGLINYGIIEDIVAENFNINLYLLLLLEVKKYFNKQQCTIIIFPTLKGNYGLTRVFKQAGYQTSQLAFKFSKLILKRNIPVDTELLIHKSHCSIDENDLYDASKWYFTGLFLEGIN